MHLLLEETDRQEVSALCRSLFNIKILQTLLDFSFNNNRGL